MQPLNLKDKIEKILPSETKKVIYECAKIAHLKDYRIFLVGGVVRDLLLDRNIFDIDITVQGDAIEFCKLLQTETECRIIQIQEDLKTAKVRFENNVTIDFASTRQEEYPQKGHLPVVTKTGCVLSRDVKRRDFTINAIAAALNSDSYGRIIDYAGGIEDLKNKTLRVLHEKSFIDDPSRIIRGLKFSVRLGFELDKKTKQLQDNYLNAPNRDLSRMRIKSELQQTFELNSPAAFDRCVAQKIYKIFTEDANKNIKGQEIFDISAKYKTEIKHLWLVYLGVLFTCKEDAEFFNFEKNEKRLLIDALDMIAENPRTDDLFKVYKFFENKCIESILIFYLVTKNENAMLFLEKLRKFRVETTGEDLINMDFLPGAQFSEIFDLVLKERLEGRVSNKREEIDFIKTLKNS